MFTAFMKKLWNGIKILASSIAEAKAARARIYMSGIQSKL
jgi:hypothetical protein